MKHIENNLCEIKQQIADAATRAGRNPEDVKLIAVSKTFPSEYVQAAYECGQRAFGENRVQELEEKFRILPEDIEWHLIGHLQGNKAARAVQCADYIHSIDSLKLLKRVIRLAEEAEVCPKILLEINISGEESKFGATEADVLEMAREANASNNVELVGLMTMAPFGADQDELRAVFGGLRKLRDLLESKWDIKLPELSMGMSSDFDIAVEEGATFVRVGTSIFGKRDYA
jgi:pyridoxal phosphate enzyme (YggS family)